MALGLPAMPQMPEHARAGFHVLAKPTGAVCNLDCKYCFFLSKEMLYPGSRFRMADALLETYIQQLLESQPGPDVIVGWQGGEPTLMGLEFFERSIEYVKRFKRPGQHVTYKAFFTHIDRPMRMMADLLRQGRYADEAMTMLAHDASA